jgi:hypothetical protein
MRNRLLGLSNAHHHQPDATSADSRHFRPGWVNDVVRWLVYTQGILVRANQIQWA